MIEHAKSSNNERDTDLFENFPDELKAFPQGVVWRKKRKPSRRMDKIPLDAKTGEVAAVSDPTTWSAYHVAVEAYERGLGDGIGFVLTEEEPFCGIDLDHCRDPQTGHLMKFDEQNR